MKKIILSIASFVLIFSGIIYIKITFFPEAVQLDVFKNMEIEYVGTNGQAIAKVESNYIKYNGKDEDVKAFIDNLSYTIEPNENLKNFDDIVVTVNIDKKTLKELNIELKTTSRTFQVRGLDKKDSHGNTNGNLDNSASQDPIIIDGYKIPSNWNLSQEEQEAYIKYLQEMENLEDDEIYTKDVQLEWQQGQGTEIKENADFLVKDYLNNGSYAYRMAYEYGNSSSEVFKIMPILEDEKAIGYTCIFKK